ncbi:delta-1-pyrroline-5-carboxylate dehydrogenase, mitochondrial [Anabrus simplex]|uniref:delta-1-pyrroline-5-carboxylate dehydrogenase, mitochondrial n=1 Tax=Anabrus simplex TaxID=316456 RepID=UPI0034DD4470
MMLSLVRRQISEVQRTGLRFLGSVLPDNSVEEFSFKNERVLGYLKGSEERTRLQAALEKIKSRVEDCPIVIGDKEYRTDQCLYQVMPHNHSHKIAKYYYATADLIKKAISTAVAAQCEWERVPLNEKLKIWDRAANLMAGEYRMQLNAATMLGQSKTVIQAEIDSAAELIDFFRFNAFQAKELLKYKPISEDPKVTLNSMRYRGMEGFVAAISPFNFTAIGGNLAYTPALMGNCVLWKPSDTAILSNYTIFKIMKEAGLPPGIVNFVPAEGPVFGDVITASSDLSAVNFTGSVGTFNTIWKNVGKRVDHYKTYPRLIGECGGKNYHFIHPSADVDSAVYATIRSAYEYGGQKCSACSRLYVPESLWPKMKEMLCCIRSQLQMGDPCDYETFLGAVIDEKAFLRITKEIDRATCTDDLDVIAGGKYDKSVGYFIEPTIIECKNPCDAIMTTELFGPVLSVYVYKDKEVNATLGLVGSSTQYALTGAVFAQDEGFLKFAVEDLRMTAGNFYVNDKSTGSVVGQQPFGGARLSGTNDKAGGPHYILRFASPQSVKETFVPLTEWKYPYMQS